MKLVKKLDSIICNNFLDKGRSVLFVYCFVLFFLRHGVSNWYCCKGNWRRVPEELKLPHRSVYPSTSGVEILF